HSDARSSCAAGPRSSADQNMFRGRRRRVAGRSGRSASLKRMATLRDTQKRMTRTALLEQGLGLLMAKGYAATTIDEIAVSAGATRATFYLHSSSKADLVRSLVDRTD